MCFQWFGAFGARSVAPASESARISGGRISAGSSGAGEERRSGAVSGHRASSATCGRRGWKMRARQSLQLTMPTVAPADSQFAKAQFTFMRFGPPRKLFFTHMAGSASST